jgi:hypothetical protein
MKWYFLFTTKMFNSKSQCVRTNEITTYIKHASSCVVQFFSSFISFLLYFFLLNKWKLKVIREYTCQDFDANRENKFLIMQLMETIVKTFMALYV